MANINFEKYFNESDNKYYDSKVIITILEDIFGKPIDEIKKYVNNSQIVVTRKQIESYLEKKFTEENPQLKKRISCSRVIVNNINEWVNEDVKTASQNFMDYIEAGRYYFEPYTLDYFSRYVAIIRTKVSLLLKIIEGIGNKDIESIQDILSDLDIVLDQNKNILKIDVVRLITPTVYNINDLDEKVCTANDLSTYLTFKMSVHSLYRQGISEQDIYPCESIQVRDLFYDHVKGNVRLSRNQREVLEKERNKSLKKSAELICDLFS